MSCNNCIAVIDFETTGLSPAMGDRATEVAIVLVDQASGKVVDSFQSLMNAGRYIPSFIESLTGISNAMVAAAPAADNRDEGSQPLCRQRPHGRPQRLL